MECLVQGDGHKGRGPDTETGEHKEFAGDPRKAETDKVATHRTEDLVAELVRIRLVEVYRESLDEDGVVGVWGVVSDGRHDRDEHVFLLVEFPRVKTMLATKHPEASSGQDRCHEAANRIWRYIVSEGRHVEAR